MYRYRAHCEVKYGHFADVVESYNELNAVMRARDLTPMTVWTPTVGRGNIVTIEIDYPDLATFEREKDAFNSDAECMKVFRRSADFVVQGSNWDELLEPAPDLA